MLVALAKTYVATIQFEIISMGKERPKGTSLDGDHPEARSQMPLGYNYQFSRFLYVRPSL